TRPAQAGARAQAARRPARGVVRRSAHGPAPGADRARRHGGPRRARLPRKVGRLDLAEVEQMRPLPRGACADAGVHALAFNPLLLLSDIDDAIWRDGPRATLIALLLVCGLVFAVLRQPRAALAVLGCLLVGFAGLLGIAAAAGVRANFLNFVVLPLTCGIGVDYAVNIVQRQRQEPGASIVRLLRETGGAVALCSATTVIGYGSLLVADKQALPRFGPPAGPGGGNLPAGAA